MTAQIPTKQIGNLVIEGIPDIPEQLTERLRQYQNTREAIAVDWLIDGSGIILSTRFGETAQFHVVTQPSGHRQQITFFQEPLFSGKVCPHPHKNGFLFNKDIGGNEAYQIFYFDINTGNYQMLTDGRSRHSGGIWSPSGQYFAYASTQRNETDYHIYLQNIDFQGEEKLLFEAAGYWMVVDWSADNQFLTLCQYCSINESYIYILDIKTKECRPITKTNEPVSYREGIWDAEGQGIYVTADDEGEFRQLKYYDIATGRIHAITQELAWDVEQLSLSPDGLTLAFTVNENGLNKLYLLDTNTHFYELVADVPLGQISGLKWHPQGQKLALTIDTAQSPSDVFVLDTVLNELERWTFSEVGGLNPKQFVTPSLIHYPTFDEVDGQTRQIPAFYYCPKHIKGPYPVLIYIHGGPESQYRPAFSSVFQYYINELGIAVIAPNVRGSVGYGKSYVQLDVGYKREDSVKDIGSLLDWIERQPKLNPEKVAVIGGSYGGYMALASMTHYNERLKCGIDIVGISNFVTFLQNTKSYRRDLRRVKYGDERDPQMRQHLENISPTTNAHKITKPMLIAQGLNDPRVPASEAEQMLKAIRKNGGHVWYLLAKDEGHGFRKKTNQDYYIRAVMLFLKRYLLDG